MKNTRTQSSHSAAALGAAALLLLGVGGARAANYTLNGNDGFNTSSFTTPLQGGAGWSSGAPPASGNTYEVLGGSGNYLLRSPADTVSYTFQGDSLKLDAGSRFLLKGISTTPAQQILTVNNLILNGGTMDFSSGTTNAFETVAGAISLSSGTTSNIAATGTNPGGGENDTFTVASVISGSGNVNFGPASENFGGATQTFPFNGTVILTGANTYTGTTAIGTPAVGIGTLKLANSLALQNSTLTTGGLGLVFDSSVASKAFTLGGLSGTTNLALVNNAATPAAVALTIGNNNSTNSYSGTLSGSGSLIKTGTGTETLTNANTYSGGTTVNGSVLSLGAANADGSGALVVNSGGTVTITAGSAINNAGAVTLAGGKILNANSAANGIRAANTPPTNNTQNLGVLTLGAGTSILDFGAGNTGAIFNFANSSGASWASGAALNVYNWTGTYPTTYDTSTLKGTGPGGGLDELFFGTNSSGLTTSQLQQIHFYSDSGSTLLGNGISVIIQNGEVSPAPEPGQIATLSMIGLGLGGLLLRARKRLTTAAPKAAA